jgi:hypothetical protein
VKEGTQILCIYTLSLSTGWPPEIQFLAAEQFFSNQVISNDYMHNKVMCNTAFKHNFSNMFQSFTDHHLGEIT